MIMSLLLSDSLDEITDLVLTNSAIFHQNSAFNIIIFQKKHCVGISIILDLTIPVICYNNFDPDLKKYHFRTGSSIVMNHLVTFTTFSNIFSVKRLCNLEIRRLVNFHFWSVHRLGHRPDAKLLIISHINDTSLDPNVHVCTNILQKWRDLSCNIGVSIPDLRTWRIILKSLERSHFLKHLSDSFRDPQKYIYIYIYIYIDIYEYVSNMMKSNVIPSVNFRTSVQWGRSDTTSEYVTRPH